MDLEDTTSSRWSEGSNGTTFLYQGIYSLLLGNLFVNRCKYLFFIVIRHHLNVMNLSLPKAAISRSPWFFACETNLFPPKFLPSIFIKMRFFLNCLLVFVFLWGWYWCNCISFGGRCGHVTYLLNSFIKCTRVEPFDPASQRLSQPIHE